ncbi:MAG: biopolymer transporter ExbD [Saprospiraceae bacterium]|nr:biopolymer transporter ExbD [Saprospiraceae bacterium]
MALKKRSKFNAEFNMSSLTDIIFLLLIFFMLTSSLTSPNTQDIDRPVSNSKTPSPQNIALDLTENGIYFVDGSETKDSELEEKLKVRIYEERLKNKEKNIKTEVTIVLSVKNSETTGTIVNFMKMSNKLGVRLILATDPNKEAERNN